MLRERKNNCVIAACRFTALILDGRTEFITPIDLPSLDGVQLAPEIAEALARPAEPHDGFVVALPTLQQADMKED